MEADNIITNITHFRSQIAHTRKAPNTIQFSTVWIEMQAIPFT